MRTQIVLNGGIESAAIVTELLKTIDSRNLVLTFIDFDDRLARAAAMFMNSFFRGQSRHILHFVGADPNFGNVEIAEITLLYAHYISQRYNCDRTYLTFEHDGKNHERYLRTYTDKLSGFISKEAISDLFPLHQVQTMATHLQAELLDKKLRAELEELLDY